MKHFLYKSKIRSTVFGGDIDNDFFAQRTGPFGDWLYNKLVVKYSQYAETREIEKVHRELTIYAQELINLYKRGKIQEARDGLREIEKYSERFMQLFDSLEKKIA